MTISDHEISKLLSDELMARRTKVMFLRNAGATWASIAAEVGVSQETCRKDYKLISRDINNENPADVLARHRAVIFDIQRANYPAMMRGDKDAAVTILRALDREAKLLGLDAPTRVLASVSGEDFANESARLIARINEMDPTTIKELERVRGTDTYIDAVPDDADGEPGEPDGADSANTPQDSGGAASGGGDHDVGHPAAPTDPAAARTGVPRPARPTVDPHGWSNIEDD